MKNIKFLLALILYATLLNSCSHDDEIDTEKPSIDLSFEAAFPTNCDTLYFGEPFELKVLFTDNVELGSNNTFSIDIHNNFDHHSHSTEVTECNLDPIKDPINPFLFIENYSIPEGLSEYQTEQTMLIPSSNESGLYDDGDYHFFISLTDKEGWSTQKGLSLKILHR